MKTLYISLITFFISVTALAQQGLVGLGTDNPEATLDIRATEHYMDDTPGAVTENDGLLVPRVNSLSVNGSVDSQLVYLTIASTSLQEGFYYWDSNATAWMPLVNSKDYGTYATLSALNTATGTVIPLGSQAILIDATGLTNWDASAITTGLNYYFCTYKDYGSGLEWRVTMSM